MSDAEETVSPATPLFSPESSTDLEDTFLDEELLLTLEIIELENQVKLTDFRFNDADDAARVGIH